MKKDVYHAYLETPKWRAKRAVALQRAGHRCQLCNAPTDLQVHHRTYERVGDEEPGDLTVLCRSCHQRFHDIKKRKPTTAQRKRRYKNRRAKNTGPRKGIPVPAPKKSSPKSARPATREDIEALASQLGARPIETGGKTPATESGSEVAA